MLLDEQRAALAEALRFGDDNRVRALITAADEAGHQRVLDDWAAAPPATPTPSPRSSASTTSCRTWTPPPVAGSGRRSACPTGPRRDLQHPRPPPPGGRTTGPRAPRTSGIPARMDALTRTPPPADRTTRTEYPVPAKTDPDLTLTAEQINDIPARARQEADQAAAALAEAEAVLTGTAPARTRLKAADITPARLAELKAAAEHAALLVPAAERRAADIRAKQLDAHRAAMRAKVRAEATAADDDGSALVAKLETFQGAFTDFIAASPGTSCTTDQT